VSSLVAGATLCDGRYRLDEVIGRGGMAVVWRAADLQLERTVAIKVISDVLADDPRFVARFEREARLAAALNHANLVKVFDFSVDTERPFLIMEYVAGGTLADRRGQELEVDSLARELLDAVAHIHSAGIVHRDIKPANVLLDASGAPRLTDFGIARGDETTGLTQTGQVLGTLKYIAPEVASGEPATVKSDLYSLGVLLGDLSGPRSDALDRLLGRLSARDPADRPDSAGEALAELDPTRALEPTSTDATRRLDAQRAQEPHEQAGGLAPYARVRRQAPRFRAGISRSQAVLAAAVLLVVLALVVVAASGGGRDERSGSTPAIAPARAGAPADQQIERLEQIVREARTP
jgi:eukaryotic-like serine/threonine-protein kinase